MRSDVDRRLALSLAVARLSTGAFFLVWSLEKVIAPELARGVYTTFYFSNPNDIMIVGMGVLQTAVVLAFMAGLFRRWTYGALLVMHAASVTLSSSRLIDPFTGPNQLFWAGVPVLALLFALYLLRDQDTLFTLRPVPETSRENP